MYSQEKVTICWRALQSERNILTSLKGRWIRLGEIDSISE